MLFAGGPLLVGDIKKCDLFYIAGEERATTLFLTLYMCLYVFY